MRARFNFSNVVFLICVVVLGISAGGSIFVDQAEMKQALKTNGTYRIPLKYGGAREFKEDKLREFLMRTSVASYVQLVLAGVLLLCALGASRREFLFSVLALAAIVCAHLTCVLLLGWDGYGAVIFLARYISLGFIITILGLYPGGFQMAERRGAC